MGIFSWDYLPLEGNSFTDQRGMNGPMIRVEIDLPPDLEASDLESIKDAVIEKYRGPAQQRLWAFRQEYGVGSTPTSFQRRKPLKDGASIDYINVFGQETVTLRIPRDAVPKKDDDNYLCMLVFYDGGSVAAIPMSTILNPYATYKTRLPYSSWGAQLVPTLQMPNNAGTLIVSKISPLNNSVSLGGFSIFATESFSVFKNSLPLSISEPIAASDGGVMYIDGGSFSQSEGRVSGLSGSLEGTPIAIEDGGTPYYGSQIMSDYLYTAHLTVQSVPSRLTAAQQADLDMKIEEIRNSSGSSGGTNYNGQYITGWFAYGKDSTVEWVYGHGWIGGGGAPDGWPMISGNLSMSLPYQFGDAYTCGMQMVSATGDASVVPWTSRDYMYATIFNSFFAAGDTDSGYPAMSSGTFISFPYSLNSAQVYYSEDLPSPTLYTPYEVLSGVDGGSFVGWLHVSNGEHFLQGYSANDAPRIFLNGSEYYASLLAALRATSIQSVMLDVPLNVIQDLK